MGGLREETMLQEKLYVHLTGTELHDLESVYRLVATTDYEVSEDAVIGHEIDVLKLAKGSALQHLVDLVAEQLGARPSMFIHEEVGGANRFNRRYVWGFYLLDRKAGIAKHSRVPR
jgi:hypothetical protein